MSDIIPLLLSRASQYKQGFDALPDTEILPRPYANSLTIPSILTGRSITVNLAAYVLLGSDPIASASVTYTGGFITGAVTPSGLLTLDCAAGAPNGTTEVLVYTITDAGGRVTNEATITVTVTALIAPSASASAYTLSPGATRVLSLTSLIAPGTYPIDTVEIVTGSTLGTATVTGPQEITIVVPSTSSGPDTLVYRVKDNQGNYSSNATLSLTVANSAPVARAFSAPVTSLGNVTLNVLGNISDADNNLGTLVAADVTIGTAPTKGSAVVQSNGQILYTHTTGSGTDTLTYRVRDEAGALSNFATITVNIASTNTAPVANDVASTTVVIGSAPIAFDLSAYATDPEGDTLAFTIVTQPTKGSASISGSILTYTPPASTGSASPPTHAQLLDNPFNKDSACHTPLGANVRLGIPKYTLNAKVANPSYQPENLGARGRCSLIKRNGLRLGRTEQGVKRRFLITDNNTTHPERVVEWYGPGSSKGTGDGIRPPFRQRMPLDPTPWASPGTVYSHDRGGDNEATFFPRGGIYNNPLTDISDTYNKFDFQTVWFTTNSAEGDRHVSPYPTDDSKWASARARDSYPIGGRDVRNRYNDPAGTDNGWGPGAIDWRHPGGFLRSADVIAGAFYSCLNATACRHNNSGATNAIQLISDGITYPAWEVDRPIKANENQGDIPYGTRLTITEARYNAVMAMPGLTTRAKAVITAVYNYGIVICDGQGQVVSGGPAVQIRCDAGFNSNSALANEVESALDEIAEHLWPVCDTRDHNGDFDPAWTTGGVVYIGGGGPRSAGAINNAWDAAGTTVAPGTTTITYRATDTGGLSDTGTVTINLVATPPELPGFTRTIKVTNRTQLDAALTGNFSGLTTVPSGASGPLANGDMIELDDGAYGTDLRVTSNLNLWIKAKTNQKATFTGVLEIAGNGVTYWGLKSSGSAARLRVFGNSASAIRCAITGARAGTGSVCLMTGTKARFIRNWVDDFQGRGLSAEAATSWMYPGNNTPPLNPLIWGNTFTNKVASTSPDQSVIRLGTGLAVGNSVDPEAAQPYGYPADYDMKALVAANLFDKCNMSTSSVTDVETDTISVRTSSNRIIDNTFLDTNYVALVAGADNEVHQNWFQSVSFSEPGGISVAGQAARLYGNRIESTNLDIRILAGNQLNTLGRTSPQAADAWDGVNDYPVAVSAQLIRNRGTVSIGVVPVAGASLPASGTLIDDHTGTIKTQVDYGGTWDTPTTGLLETGSDQEPELGAGKVIPAARKLLAAQAGVTAAWVPPPTVW